MKSKEVNFVSKIFLKCEKCKSLKVELRDGLCFCEHCKNYSELPKEFKIY